MKGALLWKRILNEGIRGWNGVVAKTQKDCDRLFSRLIASPIIVDDRVWGAEGIRSDWNDYVGAAFPFETFWIEGMGFDGLRHGAFIETGRLQIRGIRKALLLAILPEEYAGPTFYGQAVISYSERGLTHEPPVISPNPLLGSNNHRVLAGCTNIITYALCDTLLMLSCKNVALAAHPTEPKEARRAAKRHGGNPDYYRYHTLVVRPPGARSDSPAQEIGVMPRHVCRGHFAEYGPEFNKGLLFGRLSGRFYIPPHLKGDKKNGVVEKDYAIPAGGVQ